MKVINTSLLYSLLLLFSLAFNMAGQAANKHNMSAEELERWFNSDEDIVDPIKLINEGQLVFLKQEPENAPHQAQHNITILPHSTRDGWVGLSQCHDNLDAMPAAQIVFFNKRVRKLKILSSHNIDKAWVENDSVQMQHINKQARVCIELETKALWKNKNGSYSLRTGPYQRRFLDGYFPMRLSLHIKDPHQRLIYHSLTPKPQTGLSVQQKPNHTQITALFEGLLHLVVNFEERRSP